MVLSGINCSDHNPFAYSSNARAHASFSFSEFDTLTIFSTESLNVVVTVGDKVDSVVLKAPANRFWQDTTLYPPYQAKSFDLFISLYSPGQTFISVTTCLTNGDEIEKKYLVYGKTPLLQKYPLRGGYEDSLHLCTDSVTDQDVYYNWDFGNGVVVSSVHPETKTPLYAQTLQQSGMLYISEMHGDHKSPGVPFVFDLSDQQAPLIYIQNMGEDGSDTIVTGDTLFPLKALITDGSGIIDAARINGEPFDRVEDQEYVKRLIVNEENSPKEITIVARDKNYLHSEKTIWLVYDPSASRPLFTNLFVHIPNKSVHVTSKKEYRVIGGVEDYYHDTLILECNYGDAGKKTALADGLGEWHWDVSLEDDTNVVQVQALDREMQTLAEVSFTLIYDKDLVDTIPPNIWQITFDDDWQVTLDNGNIINKSYFTTKEYAELEVVTFDEGSRIDSVLVNNVPAVSIDNDTAYYTWKKSVSGLKHGVNIIHIKVMDDAGNTDEKSVTVIKNQKPYFDFEHSDFPEVLYADSLFVGSIAFYDNDVDVRGVPDNLVVYETGEADAVSKVDSTGNIRWRPTSKDVGVGTDTICLSDGFQTQCHVWEYTVKEVEGGTNPVRFVTTAAEFPAFIVADSDSLHVPLRVIDSTAQPPYTFRANRIENGISVLYEDSIVRWKPELKDTGTHCLWITITDNSGQRDTLNPCVTVTPPNRPCSLSVTYTGATDSLGHWDLTEGGRPETLTVVIHDEDLNLVPSNEEFTITYKKDGVENSLSADSNAVITMLISPLSKPVGLDTLEIRVTDSKGHADSRQFVLNYGSPPGLPYDHAPADSLFIDSTVMLSWSCDDPDGDDLLFDVYLGVRGELEMIAENIADTHVSATVHASATYYWKVIAKDGKNETEGPVQQFSHEAQNPVSFVTKPEDLLQAASTAETGLLWMYGLEAEGGKPPYTYNGSINEQPISFSDNLFMYSFGQPGMYKLNAVVTDANENKDTLNAVMYVQSIDEKPRIQMVNLMGIDTVYLDTTDIVTAKFAIVDNNFLHTHEYELTIDHDGLVMSRKIQNGREFEISFYKHPDVVGIKRIKLTVVDINGFDNSVELVIDYGV